MKLYNLISVLFHPIVIPTISVLAYLTAIPNYFSSQQKLSILGLFFLTTYIIPLIILILFKELKLIKSFNATEIKERKKPLAIMILLFYILGNTLSKIDYLYDFSMLFYATTLGLILIYILFFWKIKTSIHLLSMGVSVGFFCVLTSIYNTNLNVLIITLILLSGIVASARLHLKAHSPKEVYLGFLIGFSSPICCYFLL